MGSIGWYDEENGIALWTFAADDTMETIMKDFRVFSAMLKNADRPTYAITNLLNFKNIPRGGMSYYPEMSKLAPTGEKRAKVIGVVTDRMLVTMSTDIFSRIYPDFKERFHSFKTVEAALEFIYERIKKDKA